MVTSHDMTMKYILKYAIINNSVMYDEAILTATSMPNTHRNSWNVVYCLVW